jgi:hypothetical protein
LRQLKNFFGTYKIYGMNQTSQLTKAILSKNNYKESTENFGICSELSQQGDLEDGVFIR